MTSCRYPKCRSSDIQIIYLGKPLCSKHWDKIASMPLDKAAGILKIARTAPAIKKTEAPFELIAQTKPAVSSKKADSSKKTVSPKKPAPAKKKASSKKKAAAKKRASAKKSASSRKAARVKPMAPADPLAGQQSLFG